MPSRKPDWWWDYSWNPVAGCKPVSPGCKNCFAAQIAGTHSWPFAGSAKVHDDVTDANGTRRIFNGTLTAAPPAHLTWISPLTWGGVENPALGPEKPSLIFVVGMGDLFVEGRPNEDIDRVVASIAQSDHIGLYQIPLIRTRGPIGAVRWT